MCCSVSVFPSLVDGYSVLWLHISESVVLWVVVGVVSYVPEGAYWALVGVVVLESALLDEERGLVLGYEASLLCEMPFREFLEVASRVSLVYAAHQSGSGNTTIGAFSPI